MKSKKKKIIKKTIESTLETKKVIEKKEKKIINRTITNEKLDKYFAITKRAIDMVIASPKDSFRIMQADDFLDMAKRYYSDAQHFRSKGDFVLAFAAVNYAHAWLDAGARLRLFIVHDDQLFAAD